MTNLKVKTTLSAVTYDHKPVGKEVGPLQLFRNSKVTEVTAEELGKMLTNGHSFHPIVPDFSKGYSFRDCSASFQTVFAIDIDHHNFTVEEILDRCPVEPTLIYKTFSYTEENKRYRVVFFANSSISAKNCEKFGKDIKVEIETVNKILTVPFLEDLPVEVVAFSDLSCINPARLYYGGTEVVYCNNENRFDVFKLLRKETKEPALKTWDKIEYEVKLHGDRVRGVRKLREHLTEKEHETFQVLEKAKTPEAYHFFKKMTEKLEKQGLNWKGKGKVSKVKTMKTPKGPKAPKAPAPKATPGSRPLHLALLNEVLDNLKHYAPEGVTEMEYIEATEFLNGLPYHELFGVELDEHFVSLTRAEENASAVFFKGENGQILYHDYGTRETTNGLTILTEMMTLEWGTVFYDNLKTILGRMGIKIGSEYKSSATVQMVEGKAWIGQIMDGAYYHPIRKGLTYGIGHLYVALCNLFVEMIGTSPLLEHRQGVVVYMSYEDIHQALLTGRYGDITDMRIKSYWAFVSKVNYLVLLGLIEKVDTQELNASTREGLKAHKQKLLNQGISEEDYKEPNFYEFIPITVALLDEAYETHLLLKSKGIGVSTTKQKNIKAVDESLSRKTYKQTDKKYSEREQAFIDAVSKRAKKLLTKKGYFTEDELLQNMFQKDEWFNGTKKVTPEEIQLDKTFDPETGERIQRSNIKLGMKRKKATFKSVRSAILANALGSRVSATADIVEKFNIKEKVTHRNYVYVLTEKLEK